MSRPHSRRHAPSLMAAIATLTLTTPVASVMAQEAPPATQPPVPAEAPTQTAEEAPVEAAPAPAEAAPAPAEAAQEGEAAPRKQQPEAEPVQAAPAEAAEPAPAAEEISPIAYEPQPQASAQLEDGETQQLATVVISAQRPGEGALPDRPIDSVYGIETAVVDTPRSVSEISEKQLRQDVVRSADDLVKYAPGVTRGGGQNVNIAPQIRGQNSEIFQDGQRIFNVRHPTNFNAYEAADIVAGAPSVALGPVGSSGGYTNYVTKKPVFGKTETEVSLSQGAVSPEGSWNETRVNVDTNHGVGKTFAYRASVTINRADDFYYNVKNNWNAYYGAFAWRPFSKLRVDWNASYDDYYDFNITHGWNRVTQDLVDSYGKKYNAGRATPIISNPDGSLWSPVYSSGARDSDIIGWQARENQNGKFVPVGAVNTGPLPTATPETAGRVSGWVYDPNVPGNRVTSISPRRGQRAEDQNSATRIATQSNIHLRVTRNVELNNKFLASRSLDKNDSVGSFLGQNQNNIFDNRIELRNHASYKPFGLDVTHDSNSGLTLRHEEWESLAGNNSFNINPYDLTKNPKYKNPGDLLGIEYAGNSGSWVGTPGTPQLTSFGYLNLPAMYPVKGGLYAEKGGFPGSGGGAVYTSKGSMFTTTLFTQQNFMIEDVVGLNAGLRQSWINTEIATPFAPTPADKHKDENRFGNNSIQLSPLLKPSQNTTLYYTWDRSHSLNTGGFFNVATWGAGNTVLKPAFTSVSTLHEVGLKADIVPNKVFASLAGYLSSRDTAPDINGNMAHLETKGLEASVRLQPLRNLRTGVNLSYIHAEYSYIVPAGFSPYGFAPDNATVWGDRNALNRRTGTKYDAAGIPSYSGTGYIDYSFDFGLGAQLSAWVTSPWFVALSENVKIPTQYNLDLSVYYRQPKWDVSVNVTNLTNANNFVNGLAGSTTEFVQPMRPFAAAARAAIRF